MKQETTGTFNPTFTTQSKPQSEFVYVSTSTPSAIAMISTQYRELSDKEKLELLSKLQEWIDNKQTEMEIKDYMETPLQNLKYYFRNNDTITKEELNKAIEKLYDNERATIMNAAERFANTLGIEDEDILDYYNSLYKTKNK